MRLNEEEAQRRLAGARVARLATAGGDGQPHLVPVTFAIDGDLIYTAVDHKPKKSANLRRLRNVRENPRVALLADHYAEDWNELWWVRVDGWASVVEDERGLQDPLDVLADTVRAVPAGPPGRPGDRDPGRPLEGLVKQLTRGLAFSAPAAVEVRQVSEHRRRQVFRLDPAGQTDRLADLCQVLVAVRAAGEVLLEPATIGRGERILQVIRHQFNGLLAHEPGGRARKRSKPDKKLIASPPPPSSVSSSCLSLLRPRCSKTR